MTFFQFGDTLPPPFNIVPTPKMFFRIGQWLNRWSRESTTAKFNWYICCYVDDFNNKKSKFSESTEEDNEGYQTLMKLLIQRYLVAQESMAEEEPISFEDLDEMRFEIRQVKSNIMKGLSEIKSGLRHQQRKLTREKVVQSSDDSSNDV